jgi:hypothetical protein
MTSDSGDLVSSEFIGYLEKHKNRDFITNQSWLPAGNSSFADLHLPPILTITIDRLIIKKFTL